MKQLDVEVSPPANIMTLRLTLAHMTLNSMTNCNSFLDMNYCPVNFCAVMDRRKEMHKSPPCISRGRLKHMCKVS